MPLVHAHVSFPKEAAKKLPEEIDPFGQSRNLETKMLGQFTAARVSTGRQ